MDMMRFRDVVHWHKASGEPVMVGAVTMIPQSQALIVRLPCGGFVWNRPTALLVEQGGRTERLPIVDVTHLLHPGLLGLSVVIAIMRIVMFAQRKEHVP